MRNKLTNKLPKVLLAKKLFSILLLIALGLSCKKYAGTILDLNQEHKFTSKAEAKDYVNERLDKYAKLIASLAKNATVRKVVNDAVAKKFDGDYNVLLKDLPNLLRNSQNLKLQTTASIDHTGRKMSNESPVEGPGPGIPLVDLVTLEELLTEPIVVNADTLYPQIYIPFSEPLEEDEDDPCIIAPLTGPIAPYPFPVIISFDGDETTGQEVFDGYTYDANGLEVPCGGISECFAKIHTVWAITFNERVNGSGYVPNTTSGPPPSSPSVTPIGADLYIPNLTIKTHKESWLKGGSEIQMQWGISWSNGINPSNNQSKQFSLYEKSTYQYSTNELDVKFFTRKQINKKQSVDVNFTYAPLTSWGNSINVPYIENNVTKYRPEIEYYNYPTKGDYIYLTIYEYDNHFWEFFFGNGTSYSGGGYGFADATGNFLSNFYIHTNENPYLVTSLKIIPKNQFGGSPNTSNTDIDNDQIIFKSRHRN